MGATRLILSISLNFTCPRPGATGNLPGSPDSKGWGGQPTRRWGFSPKAFLIRSPGLPARRGWGERMGLTSTTGYGQFRPEEGVETQSFNRPAGPTTPKKQSEIV